MANENMIKFLRGNVANLPQTATAGALYFTKDEGIYMGMEDGSYHRYGDFIIVANVNALPTTGAHATCMYYCTAENILARYDSEKGWVQINKQPTAEELKTLLGLGSIAYKSVVAESDLSEELAEKVNAASEGNHAHLNKSELDKIKDGDVEKWDAAHAHSQIAHAPADAQVNIIESVKVNGTALEIKDKTVDVIIPESTKVEKSATNGNIKVDGEEVVVYTHPDKHTMEEVEGLETALAGKQDVIPENTYDAHGSAAQALADAQSYADQVEANAKAYVDEEDKFEIDMNTISALGGIAAGTNLDGMSTHDILKKLLYPYVDATVGNATASPNGGTYEKGVKKTITQVSISVTKKSEPITSVALYNGSTLIEEKTGDTVKNGGTFTFSGLSVEVPTDGNQLTVKVTYPDANGNAKTVEKKTTAMTFVYPYYMGTCAAGTTIDEALVESLTKKIESKGNKSNTFTVSDGHMVFAYPKAHGVLKSILDPNNFETIGNYTRSEVSVTGLDGTAQTYYVYVSGATTVSGFAVNFKY